MKTTLKSSARLRRRYLLLGTVERAEVEQALLDYVGGKGYGEMAPVFIEREEGLILAVTHSTLNDVRAGLELAARPIKVVKVSGTLAGLSRK